MAEQIQYKPDYLKLEPKEPIEYIGSAMVDLEHSRLPFGFFSRHILNSGETRWAVLRFDPYSKDLNSGDHYETRQAALNDALAHLDQKGFYASPFDLEGLIDKVEIQR